MNTIIETLKKDDYIIKEDVSFKTLTTYKTGGTCKFLISPKNVDALINLLKEIKKYNVKYKVLGNGSNILVSDDVFNGIVIKLDRLNNLKLDDNILTVEAGYSLISLSLFLANNNLSGFEWASGIPGTIGGAVYMNAGAYLKSISDYLISVKVLDDNLNIKTLTKKDLNYSYRKSALMENKFIVIEANFKLEHKEKEEILQVMKDRKERRMTSQPLNYPSAGSVFRNPDGDYAGRLIEECGLKGYEIGGAMISDVHANFVVNKDNATSSDIKALIELAKEKVYEKFNIDLKVEQEFFNWE